MKPRIALLPNEKKDSKRNPGAYAELFAQAVERGGGTVSDVGEATGVVWMDAANASPLAGVLDDNPQIEWVQLPWAGVEAFAKDGLFKRTPTFTCAKALYGEQVGEHALVLTLACLRSLTRFARTKRWGVIQPISLFRKRVTVLGAGGLAQTFIKLIEPFQCEVTVLRRSDRSIDKLHDVLPNTDVLVIALALTPETHGIIGKQELDLLPESAVIVNIGRGAHIDTDALVDALQNKRIAAAGLDVTDPEPLPEGHPLWDFDNVLITSHCADSDDFVAEQLAGRIERNVRNFATGNRFEGLVDKDAGY